MAQSPVYGFKKWQKIKEKVSIGKKPVHLKIILA